MAKISNHSINYDDPKMKFFSGIFLSFGQWDSNGVTPHIHSQREREKGKARNSILFWFLFLFIFRVQMVENGYQIGVLIFICQWCFFL